MGYVTNSTIERRTPLKSKTRLRSKTQMKRSGIKRPTKPMKKVGPRTKKWRTAWRFLKPEMESRGRTGCEFKFIPHECWGPLDPAHSKKRSKMKGNDVFAVAMACRRIHDHLDYECTHEEMEAHVMRAIQNGGGMIVPESKRLN